VNQSVFLYLLLSFVTDRQADFWIRPSRARRADCLQISVVYARSLLSDGITHRSVQDPERCCCCDNECIPASASLDMEHWGTNPFSLSFFKLFSLHAALWVWLRGGLNTLGTYSSVMTMTMVRIWATRVVNHGSEGVTGWQHVKAGLSRHNVKLRMWCRRAASGVSSLCLQY
jgi:hypothetical protein